MFAVSFEDRSRKVIAAAAILGLHALFAYALLALRPGLRSQPETLSVAVRFIAMPATQREWQPPMVRPQAPVLDVRPPQLALTLAQPAPSAPSAHSITLAPAQPPAPAPQALPADNGPRQISVVEYVREPQPRYPPLSRRLREQGLVVLRVVIDEQGRACEVDVETSSGHARLDAAAREAVLQAAFRPYVEDGMPRRAQVLVPIEFALGRGTA